MATKIRILFFWVSFFVFLSGELRAGDPAEITVFAPISSPPVVDVPNIYIPDIKLVGAPQNASGADSILADTLPGATTCRPVVISSGQKILVEKDFEDSGDMPLSIVRHYSSVPSGGMFASGWRTEFDTHLNIVTSSGECRSLNNGAQSGCDNLDPASVKNVTFAGIESSKLLDNIRGGVFFSSDNKMSASFVGDAWVVSRVDGASFRFSKQGKMLSETNLNGISWFYQYDGGGRMSKVVHSSGRELGFSWNDIGKFGKNATCCYIDHYVASITLPDGSSITYPSYKTFGYYPQSSRLERVEYPAGAGFKTYGYNDSKLTSVSIDGVSWSDYQYTSDLSLVNYSGLFDGIERSSFLYSGDMKGLGSVVVTNAKGGKQTYSYDASRRLVSLDRAETSACPFESAKFEYVDTKSSVVKYKEDWSGNRTSYIYYGYKSQLGSNGDETITEGQKDLIHYEYVNGITKEYFWDTYGRMSQLNIWSGAKDSSLCKPGATCLNAGAQPSVVTKYVYDNANSPSYKNRLMSETTKALKYNSDQYSPERTTTYSYTFYPNNIVHELTMDGPSSGSDRTVKVFDDNGNLRSITNSKQQTITFDYDNRNSGLANHVTDANDLKTDFIYDGKGRLKTKTVNDGVSKTTQYEYYGDDQIKKVIYPNGAYVANFLDSSWRIYRTESPLPEPYTVWANGDVSGAGPNAAIKRATSFTYDRLSNVEKISTDAWLYSYCRYNCPTFVPLVLQDNTYDEFGLLKQSKGQNGQSLAYKYDGNNNVKETLDANGLKTTYTYTTAGKLETQTNPLNETTTYHYDGLGNLSEVIDPNGGSTQYHRNGFGEVEERISPDTGKTTYKYNTDGSLLSETNANNVTVTYAYDDLGRVTSAITSGGANQQSITYYYDTTAPGAGIVCENGKGRLCGFIDNSGATNYSYNKMGAVAAKEQRISGSSFVVSNTFDAYGRVDETTYPYGVKLKYGYDINNGVNVIKAWLAGAWKTVVSRSSFYDHQVITYANGITRTINLDRDARVSSITSANQNWTYGYKSNTDLISSITNPAYSQTSANQSYDYDAAGRLNYVSRYYYFQKIQYDKNGNRLKDSKYGGETNTYTPVVAGNKISRITSTNTYNNAVFDYDAVGNMRSDSSYAGHTNTYDDLNRLKTSYSPRTGITANYSYNALNQRVYKCRPQKCSHYLFNDSGELVYDNLPVSPNYYIYLDGQVVSLINNGQIYAVEDDHLGRPEVITDAARTIVWKAVNYDFSREVSINKITFYLGFPGQYYDVDTDLWYNWNRWYDAKLGRYTQSDPIGLAGGINTYAYAGNNPVKNIDPTGLDVTITISNRNYSNTGNSVSGNISVTSNLIPTSFSGYTMENAHAGNNGDKSPIPAGTYSATRRLDHTPNRVELQQVPGYQNIQIHNGSFPQNYKGCIGAGTTKATDFLGGTVNAMGQINNIISADGTGNITVIVGAVN